MTNLMEALETATAPSLDLDMQIKAIVDPLSSALPPAYTSKIDDALSYSLWVVLERK